jgi:hypothetical protein
MSKKAGVRSGEAFTIPNFNFGMSGVALLTLIMANIGTTITPWQIFFQQSAVVDKGMDIKDIKYGKFDTLFGSFMTCVVAAFIIIATAGVFHFNPDQSQGLPGNRFRRQDGGGHAPGAARPMGAVGQGALCHRPVRRRVAGRALHLAGHKLGDGRGLRLGALAQQDVREAPWFYVAYVLMLMSAGVVSLIGLHRTCRTSSPSSSRWWR